MPRAFSGVQKVDAGEFAADRELQGPNIADLSTDQVDEVSGGEPRVEWPVECLQARLVGCPKGRAPEKMEASPWLRDDGRQACGGDEPSGNCKASTNNDSLEADSGRARLARYLLTLGLLGVDLVHSLHPLSASFKRFKQLDTFYRLCELLHGYTRLSHILLTTGLPVPIKVLAPSPESRRQAARRGKQDRTQP